MASVLLIDDDPGTLEGYGGILRCAGFDVATASSGREGFELARNRPFDLVLADLRLPDQSGLDILRELRHLDIQIPFVIITAWATVPTATESFRLGAGDYVEKPLDEDALLHVVRRTIGTKRVLERDIDRPGEPTIHPVAR